MTAVVVDDVENKAVRQTFTLRLTQTWSATTETGDAWPVTRGRD